jgi:site-specific recombinase XerD
MSTLSVAAEQYLEIRRGLGAKLVGVDNVLRSFTDFAAREEASHVTTDLVLRWANEQTGILSATQTRRFQLVRAFAAWRSATDPRTEVPPKGLLSGRYQRQRPYLYNDREIEEIIQAARQLPPSTSLRGHTYATIFALLSVTGLRVSEAIALDREDVRLAEGMLCVRHTKFDKSRLVPVHASTSNALACYAGRRDHLVRRPTTAAFFLSDRGLRVPGCSTRYTFAKVSRQVGLRALDGGRHGHGPRLHDLRHYPARRISPSRRAGWYGGRGSARRGSVMDAG